jgi:hypothetical protein
MGSCHISTAPQHQTLLDELADIARQIEAHRTTVWLLERQLRIPAIVTGCSGRT